MKLNLMAVLGLALTSFGTSATAQSLAPVIIQDVGTSTDFFVRQGQSFIWVSSDPLAAIAVVPATNVLQTVDLYIYGGAVNCLTPATASIYTQPGNVMATNAYHQIDLSSHLNLTNGGTYTFCLHRTSGGSTSFRYSAANPYPGGNHSTEGGLQAARDMRFQLYAAVPNPVPTLTEWAMILLGLLLAGGAAVHLQRRGAAG